MTNMGNNARYEEEQTAKYYEAYYETKYKRTDMLEKSFLTKLFSHFSEAETVLEVGSGTGHFTRWIESTLGFEGYGVDLSKAMLKEAKKRWPRGALLQSDAARLPFKDKSVDVVVFITSLEFMPDAAVAIKEASRVAEIGLIFGIMNKNSLSTLRKQLQSKTQKNSFYREAKFYSISDIKKMLDEIFPKRSLIAFWSTTVFPKGLGSFESSRLPFGDFLGIIVMLRDVDE